MHICLVWPPNSTQEISQKAAQQTRPAKNAMMRGQLAFCRTHVLSSCGYCLWATCDMSLLPQVRCVLMGVCDGFRQRRMWQH